MNAHRSNILPCSKLNGNQPGLLATLKSVSFAGAKASKPCIESTSYSSINRINLALSANFQTRIPNGLNSYAFVTHPRTSVSLHHSLSNCTKTAQVVRTTNSNIADLRTRLIKSVSCVDSNPKNLKNITASHRKANGDFPNHARIPALPHTRVHVLSAMHHAN